MEVESISRVEISAFVRSKVSLFQEPLFGHVCWHHAQEIFHQCIACSRLEDIHVQSLVALPSSQRALY